MDMTDYASLPRPIVDILRKYYLVTTTKVKNPDGTRTPVEGWRMTEVRANDPTTGKPLGMGPLVEPEVLNRFLQADTTPGKIWFEWMIFQAGGGKTAQKRSDHLMDQTHKRFLAERSGGYTDERKVYHAGVGPERAAVLWEQAKNYFLEMCSVSDQDFVGPQTHNVFGFYRKWPGRDRIYERVALAVGNFLKMGPKIKAMNNVLAKNDQQNLVSFKPKDYDSIESLTQVISRVQQFYASKQARKDIRFAPGPNGEKTIYDDDFMTVRVPLTYAAAVQYGWPNWAWADPEQFERGLATASTNRFSDPWKKVTDVDNSLFVYIQFNVPMPAWVTYKNNRMSRYTLRNLALVIPHSSLKTFDVDTIPLWDEENNNTITLTKLKERIRAEAQRPADYNPDDEEYPQKVGPRTFQSTEEAEEVVQHLESALDATKRWAATFDPNQVVADYMGNSNK